MMNNKIEEALEMYFNVFGKKYTIMITSQMSDDEIVADIMECIESKKEQEPFRYDDENIY